VRTYDHEAPPPFDVVAETAATAGCRVPRAAWDTADAAASQVTIHGFPIADGEPREVYLAVRAALEGTLWRPVLTSGLDYLVRTADLENDEVVPWFDLIGRTETDRTHEARVRKVVHARIQDVLHAADATPDDPGDALDDLDPDTIAARLGPAPDAPTVGKPRGSAQSRSGALWLGLIPAEEPWHVPFLLGLPCPNNWSAWPYHGNLTVADHGAFVRTWYERYGAEPYYLTRVDLELYVPRPPLDPTEAARAAAELAAYCYDVHGEGMVRSDLWALWWD
jgi:hypothetical protein